MTPNFKRGSKGFTLVEIIIVIAVMAVLAAVVIPNVSGYLSRGKERAYVADKATIQAAVDAYYSDPGNDTYRGKRQYPIWGQDADGSVACAVATDDCDVSDGENPDRGTKGGSPVWVDDDDDAVRDAGEKWDGASTTKGSKTYEFSTGNYIIDIDKLVDEDFLKAVPDSASADNKAGLTGHYTWYVKADGTVESLFYDLPESTSTGYQSGVYP